MQETKLAVRLTDSEGKIYRWNIRRVPRANNLVSGQKPRVVSGWEFIDHDGYTRFAEGNWRDLVFLFKLTAAGYGLELSTDLS